MSHVAIQRKPMVIILSAPSGGGKTSICREVIEKEPIIAYSVSTTSRPPRPKELEGVDYNFVTRDEFERLIADGQFYEHAQVYENYYGTRRDRIEALLEEGRDVILDLDIQGGLNFKRQREDAILIFILPPSLEVLKRRLVNRKSDTSEVVERRLRSAEQEMRKAVSYDYIVMNDDFDETVRRVRSILRAERCRSNRQTVLFDTKTPFTG